MRSTRIVLFFLVALGAVSPATAAEEERTLGRFLSLVIGNDRPAAEKLVDGSVAQLENSTTPMVVKGGPHAGIWKRRIIEGRDSISSAEAFSTFSQCNFWKLESFNPNRSPAEGYVVHFFCPDSTAVWFAVRPSSVAGKVVVFNLSRKLLAAPGDS